MPKLVGLFDSFDNLDTIAPENIARWLKPKPQLTQLENYLANRILYPQAVAQTEVDMKIDLAILREALREASPQTSKGAAGLLGDNPFLNLTLRKILIPKRFLSFVPDLVSLVWVFLDGLLLDRPKEDWFEDLWTVVLTGDLDEIVGSILLPQFEAEGGLLELSLEDKSYKIRPGSLIVIPCPFARCEIAYKLTSGKILGKKDSALEIYGGRLGLMIDGRRK